MNIRFMSIFFLLSISSFANANNLFEVSEAGNTIRGFKSEVAINSYGQSLVAWSSVEYIGSSYDEVKKRWVSARVIDSESNFITDIFTINLPEGHYAEQIRPLIFNDGSLVISWSQRTLLSSEDDGYIPPAIYTQKFDPNGYPIGEQVEVASREHSYLYFENLDISYSPDSSSYCLMWAYPMYYEEGGDQYRTDVHSACYSIVVPGNVGSLFFPEDLKCDREYCISEVMKHSSSPIIALNGNDIVSVTASAVSTEFETLFEGKSGFISRLVDVHSNNGVSVVLWSQEESSQRNDDVFDEEGVYARVLDSFGESISDVIKISEANVYGPRSSNVAVYSDGSFIIIENEAYYRKYNAAGEEVVPRTRFLDSEGEYHSGTNRAAIDINAQNQIVSSWDGSSGGIFVAQSFDDLSYIQAAYNSNEESGGGSSSPLVLVLLLSVAVFRRRNQLKI